MATHASRDTTTGAVNELSIETFLKENQTRDVHSQVWLGYHPNGTKKHKLDILLGGQVYVKENNKLPTSLHKGGELISLKYQGVDGTAEEKVPYEFIKLQHSIDRHNYEGAVIVLCGDGWTLKEYYLSDNFKHHMKELYPDVEIMSEDNFRNRHCK
tara:strand:- start:810 stop:1277 length:468 start_codon:yes stop_codon:yes gene_type:complete